MDENVRPKLYTSIITPPNCMMFLLPTISLTAVKNSYVTLKLTHSDRRSRGKITLKTYKLGG